MITLEVETSQVVIDPFVLCRDQIPPQFVLVIEEALPSVPGKYPPDERQNSTAANLLFSFNGCLLVLF